jgi:hypothetical protein
MIRVSHCVILAILLSGCVPIYHLPKNATYARVRLSDVPSANMWVCQSNQIHRLIPDKSGYAKIAADQRLTLGVSYYNYVYQGVSTYCTAGSSLIPESSASYYLDFEMEAERCMAIPYKEGAKTRIGLEFEPTLTPTTACLTR